jgi:hypothetical protein
MDLEDLVEQKENGEFGEGEHKCENDLLRKEKLLRLLVAE